jgi:DNA-directed RNA polymerase specialized sigma24 family protein
MELGSLRRAAAELTARERRVVEARERRDELIVQASLETQASYAEIGEATGLSVTAVWKITSRAGVSRQRVRQLPEAASG